MNVFISPHSFPSLLNVASRAEIYPKFYLEDPPMLALGELKTSSIEEASQSPYLHLSLSGFEQGEKLEGCWEGFSSSVYLPRFIITPSQVIEYSHASSKSQIPFSKKNLSPLPSLLSSRMLVSKEDYITKVTSLISSLKSPFSKAVFATVAQGEYDGCINPFALLPKKPRNSCNFAFAISKETAFIGSSPEILYTREGRMLFSHALARTAPTESDDERLLDPLLIEEFRLVQDCIKEAFTEFCSIFKESPLRIKHLKTLKHLSCDFKGILKENIFDKSLFSLSPTPALCGTPREKALAWIKENEILPRGLYGGHLGILSKNFAKQIVSIRSSLIRENTQMAFAGSGIVKNSKPEEEWEEIKQKLALWNLNL